MISRKISTSVFLISGCVITLLSLTSILTERLLPLPFYILLSLLGVILIIVGFVHGKNEGKAKMITTVMTVLLILYLIGEVTVNALIWTKTVPDKVPGVDLGFGVFNEPCASYDPVRGFRWDKGTWRISKIINKHVVYDNWFAVNRQGVYFNEDYEFEKKDSSKRRYIVFGDSFTAGEFLERPWPQYCNELADQNENPIDFYSFAINGGGLYNWHSTFFKEIVPQYEFDGVILAVFANDLERKFFVMDHREETGYTGYLDTIPANREDLMANYSESLNNYANYMPDSLIDQKKAEALKNEEANLLVKPRLYFLTYLIALPTIVKQKATFRKFLLQYLIDVNDNSIGLDETKQAIGEDNYDKLQEMIQWCKDHQKQVVIASLPYEPAIPFIREGMELKMTRHCKTIAKHQEIEHYDAMKAFSLLDDKGLEAAFLPFDVHWSQEGSDHFARAFYDYFTDRAGE